MRLEYVIVEILLACNWYLWHTEHSAAPSRQVCSTMCIFLDVPQTSRWKSHLAVVHPYVTLQKLLQEKSWNLKSSSNKKVFYNTKDTKHLIVLKEKKFLICSLYVVYSKSVQIIEFTGILWFYLFNGVYIIPFEMLFFYTHFWAAQASLLKKYESFT